VAIRQPVKSLAKNSFIYGLGNVTNKIAAVILIPFLTHKLSLSEVGFVAIIEMLDIFLISIFLLGLGNTLFRYLPGLSKDEQAPFIASVFWGQLSVNVIILIVWLFYQNAIIDFIGIPNRFRYLFPFIILNSLLTVTGRFFLRLWRHQERPKTFITLSLFQFIGNLSIAIFLLVGLNFGVESVVYSKTIIYGLSALITIVAIVIRFPSLPNWKDFKKAARFGFPLIPMALVPPVLTTSDRLFLNHFVTLDKIGIYSIGYKFGMLINIFLVTPLQTAWMPLMFKMNTNDDSKSTIRDLVYYFSFISAGILLLVTAFRSEFILILATPDYLPGAIFVPVIALAYLINGYRHFFMAGSALKDKTVVLGGAALSSIGVNIILNYFMIKSWGLWGAAIATLMSYSYFVSVIYFVSEKQIQFHWDWKRITKLFGWTGILAIPLLLVGMQITPVSVLIKVIILILFPISARYLGLLNIKELNGLKILWNVLRNKIGLNSR